MKRLTQISVYLEPQILLAAKQRATEMKVSLSAAIVSALKESLLATHRSEREQEILKAVERNFHALRRLDQRVALEIQVLKEMVGLGMRSFFNHTTPIPEATKAAAILSGKQRFHGYLDILAKNLRMGQSILDDLPLPEFGMPHSASSPPPTSTILADPEQTKGDDNDVSRPNAEHGSDPLRAGSRSPMRQNLELFERSDGK